MNYTISEFSSLCGISATTLRAWQRRYGLLNPARTAGGHRRFSDEDVLMAARILVWVEKGVPTGRIPQLIQHEQSEKNERFIAKQSSLLSALRQGKIAKASRLFDDFGQVLTRQELVNEILRPVRMRLSMNTPEIVTLRAMLDGLILTYASGLLFSTSGKIKKQKVIFGWKIFDVCEIWLEALLNEDKKANITVLPAPLGILPQGRPAELEWVMVTAGIMSDADKQKMHEWRCRSKERQVVII